MRIALDAMGGDAAPAINVEGAARAATEYGFTPNDGVELVLVGPEELLRRELRDRPGADLLAVHDAPDIIGMDEHPATAVRRKRESSIVVGARLVREGRADAFVSAGNTGAVMAAGLLVLGRVPGIDRPAIGSLIPTPRGRTLLIDAGANADVRAEHLVQFARMGAAYMARMEGVERPAVGLLSVGEEDAKGNALTLEAHALLRAGVAGFAGNVEGRDIPRGAVDVVVTDGFTGNVALKAMEGTASAMGELLREEVTRGARNKLAALALRGAFRRVRARLDPNEVGGSPLLGVRGAVFICHGSSTSTGILNALRAARRAVEQDVVGEITRGALADVAPPGAGSPGPDPPA